MNIKAYLFLCITTPLLFNDNATAQSTTDITRKNSEQVRIRSSRIKSKSVIEYHYAKDNPEVFADSGYKSFYFSYDNYGRLTSYTKYHIFSALTIKEVYSYSGDNIIETIRYNSAGDMIETIEYRYNSTGKLKKEIHTAYYNSIRPGVHFTILASIKDNEMFSRLQDELEIDPKLESYTITVNIADPEELNQYVVIGDEMDPTSPRYSWSQLSMTTQRELLGFTGPNRKEHAVISKNIAEISYKYDKKGNLIKKSIYNTSDDLVEQETFRYNGDNLKVSYYKYNEKGRISSMETYSYEGSGRLAESAGLDPSGVVISRLVYKYNETGSLDEKIWYNANGEINGNYKYIYDEGNKIAEEVKYRGENEKEGRMVYNYDTNGNILEIIKYDINDKKEKLIKYVYEFY